LCGLYCLYGGDLKKSKAELEKAVVSGKSVGVNGLVAKCYYVLGTNSFVKGKGGGKGGVVGGTSYVVLAPKAAGWGGDKGHVHYLHRAFVFAKASDMGSLAKSVRKALDNCIEDEASEFNYDANIVMSGAAMSGGEFSSGQWSDARGSEERGGGGNSSDRGSEWLGDAGGLKLHIGGGGAGENN